MKTYAKTTWDTFPPEISPRAKTRKKKDKKRRAKGEGRVKEDRCVDRDLLKKSDNTNARQVKAAGGLSGQLSGGENPVQPTDDDMRGELLK